MVKVLAERRRRGPGWTPAAPQSPHCVVGGFVGEKSGRGKTLLPKVRSLGHQHGHHLGVCREYRVSAPELLSQNLYYLKKKKKLFWDHF